MGAAYFLTRGSRNACHPHGAASERLLFSPSGLWKIRSAHPTVQQAACLLRLSARTSAVGGRLAAGPTSILQSPAVGQGGTCVNDVTADGPAGRIVPGAGEQHTLAIGRRHGMGFGQIVSPYSVDVCETLDRHAAIELDCHHFIPVRRPSRAAVLIRHVGPTRALDVAGGGMTGVATGRQDSYLSRRADAV